ncbi:MAG: NADH-quinone oxidoreductase subunit NuoH [Verrucomicrobiia bacterium]
METLYQLLISIKTDPSVGRWLGFAPDWGLRAVAIVVSVVLILAVFLTLFAFLTWVERKTLGRIQNRLGPNRVGPIGLFQPIADGLKILLKEDIIPRGADALCHFLAPVLFLTVSLMLFAVLPIGRGLIAVDLNIGILFVFAVGAASVLALFMGGWASRNKFSLLGAMRSVAQIVSYEVPTVLAAVVVLMAVSAAGKQGVGSLSTVSIVEAQAGGQMNASGWFIFQPWGLVGFILFFIGTLAESARTPFDLPEAESEIVAGYHTEYSGFKFALFQMGEYLVMIAMSGFTVTMFLGGYLGPGVDMPRIGWLLSIFWFLAKLSIMIFLVILARGTWPRVRVDQLMGFAWKLLLPMALVNIVAFGFWFYLGSGARGWFASATVLVVAFALLTRGGASTRLGKRTYRYSN